MPTHIIYWFRDDLRLHDNEGFSRALAHADAVLPVFVVDPRWFTELPVLQIHKMGAFRLKFVLEAVADLRQSLRTLGADLIVRVGNPALVLADLAESTAATAIYASKEVTQEETDVESELSKRLKPLNIDLDMFWMSTLYHVRDLPFPIAKLPEQFTNFRMQIEKQATVRSVVPTPTQVNLVLDVEAGDIPVLTQFGFSDDDATADPRAVINFQGGETVALQRVNQYIWKGEHLKTYKDTRNALLGESYSSKFSAWLAHGCLSPRFVYAEVQRYEQERIRNDSTYWLIFELLWRDFFRFVALKYGTRIFKPSGIRHNIHKRWLHDQDLFMRWATGQTGIPFIDANMRELTETGFVSNRGRQNVGSFLVNELGIDWTWGAAWFESFLVDYDPCSNWGNWNYIAGVGNDPRSHGDQARHLHIDWQATTYDEQGTYVKYWLPELAAIPAGQVHHPWTLSNQELASYGVPADSVYTQPIINPDMWLTQEKGR